jgi:hypothetical protein
MVSSRAALGPCPNHCLNDDACENNRQLKIIKERVRNWKEMKSRVKPSKEGLKKKEESKRKQVILKRKTFRIEGVDSPISLENGDKNFDEVVEEFDD